MQEKIVQFGPHHSLLGVLTTPDPSVRVPDAPTAIILNAGIVHRIGPFRMHVDIARSLAEAGFSTLRMDLSGLGDSLPRTEKLEGRNRSTLDVVDAMDALKGRLDNDRFVILGLCSGAFNAHQVAVADDRIVGAVFIDGIVFRTMGYFFRHTLGRLFRPRVYRNAIKRRYQAKKSGSIQECEGNELAESEFFFAQDIDRQSVVTDLNNFLKRGMRMLFLYTDGYEDICGKKQFEEMYGIAPSDQLQVDYYEKSEHTFTIVEHREMLCRQIADWYGGQFANSVSEELVAT